ncbi:3-oxoacyl-acyl-carrier-protein reductase fabg-like protein [Dermatophagoides farinae]|uniref:3-oxoacyl-acyl-carrier-protein reductase fabg-like protein n=1 Tax=Dermatophagoides farinae TaxID=6954 RepID=A0A9D4P6L0_DERFA|nr:3-oxoacyl-[acyl-carrier-protein] reductase FabG-like [Dermatophagoides farinae]XP_046919018.1 3-oxoacyl-[acyl-carrier-protein] reductase FabG-like [Dermatophagoides farinae]KAH7644569.1 3-oxoacyl-acyl-carrier-protein reductase fabg-like protein [Dermatophagoides farinae]
MSKLLSNISFASKVVLITGASSGIGRETAIHFSRLGAHLCLTGRNNERLQQTIEACRQQRQNSEQKIISHVGDIGSNDQKAVKELMDKTIAEYNRLDVLVNNAGIIEMGTIETTSLDQYDRVMNLNLRAIYHLTMLAVPYLIQSKGNIVNVSSVNGIRSFPGVLAYNISKAGLDQLTRCTALELASKGVRVNSVNPGVVVTNIHKASGLNDEQYQRFLEHSKTTHAIGRVGDVAEIASAITYLASDSATFITGASLPVDGGRHAMCPR